MRRAVLLAVLVPALAHAAPARDLKVELTPDAHWLSVSDTVRPEADGPRTLHFLLDASLQAGTTSPGVTVEGLSRAPQASDFGMTGDRF